MTVIETKHMHAVSQRRGLYELRSADNTTVDYIGMWIDGVQIAAALRKDDWYAEHNGGAEWALWSSRLSVAPIRAERGPTDTHPLALRTEADARAWLDLLADLAEHGPRIVETRQVKR